MTGPRLLSPDEWDAQQGDGPLSPEAWDRRQQERAAPDSARAMQPAHIAPSQQDETTPRGLARRAANRMDVSTTRLVANILDLFGADEKAKDFRTIAQGTEDTLADARTVPGKLASVAGYVAPQAMATVLGARGLAAVGEGAGALGMARTARAAKLLAGGKGAGLLRRNVGGAVAAAPLITVPGALSDDPRASTVGVLSESLPEESMLGKAARTVASTKAGRLAADLGIDVLAGSALEGVGRGAGAAARGVGRQAAKALDVSEGMVEAGAKAAGEEVDEAARIQGRGFARATDDERAAKALAESEAITASERADALDKLEETKLEARHAAMERDARKAKPKALPPSPDEGTNYDVETYRLNRDANADVRGKMRAEWEATQEREGIQGEATLDANGRNADGLFEDMRTPGGAFRPVERVSKEGLLRQMVEYTDNRLGTISGGRYGAKAVTDAMTGKLDAIEAELVRRGMEPDEIWTSGMESARTGTRTAEDAAAKTADEDTSFLFGANAETVPEPASASARPITAVKLDDGTVVADPEAAIHAQLIANKGVDPARVVDGGFIVDGEYRSGSSHAGPIGEQARAAARVAEKRANRLRPAEPPASEPVAAVVPPVAHPVTAETMLSVGKQRAAELETGAPRGTMPDLTPAMEREGRMFGDVPSRGTMFDVGGAVAAGLKGRFGTSATVGATGAALEQSDDEKIQATGSGLMALAAIHAVGLPRIKAGGAFVGKEAVEQMKQSPLGVKVLNGISHDILADPKVKTLFSAYQDAVSKGRARAAELSKAAKRLGPAGDRQVSDAIERETFEPLTGDQTAVLAVAQRISDEFTALGRGKVREGLLAEATVAKREGRYLPRMYAEHLGESATDAAARVVKQTTRKPRIVGDKQRMDLPDAVRNQLGEVREASFRTAFGLDKGYRDLAASKLFAGLREMPGVVHPEFAAGADALTAARTSGDALAIRAAKQQLEGLAKTLERAGEGYTRLPDTPGLGILRGAVVRDDVGSYLKGAPEWWTGWKGDLYSYWKRVHTVMNPGTHVGNTMSNSVVAHMSGLPVWAQPKALKQALADYNSYGPTTRALAELGILERGLPTIADAVPIGGRKMRTALTELSETTRPETKGVLAERGITPRGMLRKGFDTIAQKMEAAYSKEDGVFRVATFNRLVADGMEPRAAADYVDRAFVNYQTRSPLLGAIKNTVSPFILYPAKAIPFVAGQIVEHPWRWATLAAAWGAMDQYSQKKVGEIAQADLRSDQRVNKRLGYLVPGFTQLPFTNEKGDRYGIDVARWTPFSALTGAPAPGSLAMALGGPNTPAIVQPSGPFLDIGARVMDTDPYTGRKMTKPGDDLWDKAANVVKGAASLTLPSAASFHLPRVVGDLRNADPKAAAIDALGFVGAKPSVVRPGAQRTRELREYAAARANIIGDLRYDLQRAKSPERKRALEAAAREKLLRLAGPMQELAGQK